MISDATGGATAEEGFSFSEHWNDVFTFFTTQYWNIIFFFLVLLFGIIFIKLFITLLKKGMAKGKMEKIAQSFIINVR